MPYTYEKVVRPIAHSSGERWVNEVFDAMRRVPSVVLLTAQDGFTEPEVLTRVTERARLLFGSDNTFHVKPLRSPTATVDEYFVWLARQVGFSDNVRNALDWQDALDDILRSGHKIFFLMSCLEDGSEEGRCQLANILRALLDTYLTSLSVVLSGGERLLALKYEQGALSLLNFASQINWPEATGDDILAWQRLELPVLSLSLHDAEEIRGLCGGNPRWIRYALEQRQQGVGTRDALDDYDEIWRIFTPHRGKVDDRRRICQWLGKPDLEAAEPWISDALMRRLYWRSALRAEGGRLVWRSDVVREVGRKALRCA